MPQYSSPANTHLANAVKYKLVGSDPGTTGSPLKENPETTAGLEQLQVLVWSVPCHALCYGKAG